MTEMDKFYKYRKGLYKCEVPSVCTAYWHSADWIKWIDNHGVWL